MTVTGNKFRSNAYSLHLLSGFQGGADNSSTISCTVIATTGIGCFTDQSPVSMRASVRFDPLPVSRYMCLVPQKDGGLVSYPRGLYMMMAIPMRQIMVPNASYLSG